MLSCKQVATVASDYLDKNTPLKWQIRLHLLMCANCRRFVRHLKITQQVGANITLNESAEDAEAVWKNLQARLKNEVQSNKE
ncbi:MAG TPA: hypothetical protein VGE32_01945 [Cellvibrio sp.]